MFDIAVIAASAVLATALALYLAWCFVSVALFLFHRRSAPRGARRLAAPSGVAETARAPEGVPAVPKKRQRVVIVGAGFAGLACARALSRAPVQVTVVDRRNHHLF
mgnify:CR=1 FL=1